MKTAFVDLEHLAIAGGRSSSLYLTEVLEFVKFPNLKTFTISGITQNANELKSVVRVMAMRYLQHAELIFCAGSARRAVHATLSG